MESTVRAKQPESPQSLGPDYCGESGADNQKEKPGKPGASKRPLTLGDSVQAGLSNLGEAMIEVAKITAAAQAAGTPKSSQQMGRIEKLLEQQSESMKQNLINVKLLEPLDRIASK